MPGQRGACWALQFFAPQLSPAAPVQCIVVIVVYSAPFQPGNAPEQCMLGNVLHNFPNRSRMVPFLRRLAWDHTFHHGTGRLQCLLGNVVL